MVNTRTRISAKAIDDRLVHQNAIQDAADLFRDYGVGAIDLIIDGLLDQTKSAADRRHGRLMITELERLDRLQRQGQSNGSQQLVVWKPPLFSLATIRSFFRRKPRRGLR
jgi:hypothetical protein